MSNYPAHSVYVMTKSSTFPTDFPEILYTPIGIVHSEHLRAEQTPVQPVFAKDCSGTVEIFPPYAAGLQDIEGFSHLYLIYHMHCANEAQLVVTPFLHDTTHGIFATRYPRRPNPIGLSIVELLSINGNILSIRGVDILDGTPILDIKPYTARFDHIIASRNGWFDEVDEQTAFIRGRRQYSRSIR